MESSPTVYNSNSNNQLYLHGHKREFQHCKSMLRKAESVIILEGISRNQPLIMRKCLRNLFHSFNAFFDLSGDNYIDYADDVITKLRHQHIYMYYNF